MARRSKSGRALSAGNFERVEEATEEETQERNEEKSQKSEEMFPESPTKPLFTIAKDTESDPGQKAPEAEA